ncbi:hypothetical protein BDR07DRAFT_1384318 [Suillus spraguei]|nr:hypothetical protein BDR07DRAFT_1384318 [Suillus spraguei]
MDKLTTEELNHLVLEEPSNCTIKSNAPLGHLLSIIFQSFKADVPGAEDLLIPLSKIKYSNERIGNRFRGKKPTDSVELWDSGTGTWNWGLPDPPPKQHERSKKGKKNKSHYEEGAPEGQVPGGSTSNSNSTTEHVVAGFFNALTAALSRHGLETKQANRVWSGAYSTTPIKGDDTLRKPDIILSDEPDPGWAGVKVAVEVTSSKYRLGQRVTKSLDTKAYRILKHQPWRRFVLMLSLCHNYRELRVHVYDHSGSAVSPPFHIVRQKDKFLKILSSIVFGNGECIGFDMTMDIRQLKIPVVPHRTRPPRRLRARIKKDTNYGECGTRVKLEDVASDEGEESGYESESALSCQPSPSRCIETLDSDSLSSAFTSLETDDRPDIRTGPPALPFDLPRSATPVELLPFIAQNSVLPNSSPIGKIHVNNTRYDILEVIWSSHGLVGRGTVCYLTRKDGQEYIIKDHWVVGNTDDDILNEVFMLQKMQGVRGVPELVESSKVKLSSGEVDNTKIYRFEEVPSSVGTWRTHVRLAMKPRGRLLHAFRTKLEFVQAIRDIVTIQQEAHKRGVLHRDCSLHNAMIEDAVGNGMLIDWEFAVVITSDNRYPLGGTGTIPFMSRRLLQQVKKIWIRETARKGASSSSSSSSSSSPLTIDFVTQDYTDDLESLFYVFSWICIEYSGPLGIERHLNASKEWLPHAWSNRNIAGCFDSKFTFFTTDDGQAAVRTQFDDYFQDLVPLALEWRDLLVLNFPIQVQNEPLRQPIEFDALFKILDKHIDRLREDTPELLPERLFRKRLVDKNIKDVYASGQIMKNMDCVPVAVKKRSLNDEWTIEPAKRCRVS